MEPRQTQSYLRNLLAERRIRPKRKLGQSFLVDLNLIDLIVRTAELATEDLVLEVGSGTGSLTNMVAAAAGAVVTVEVDPDFAAIAREAVADKPNVVPIHADILRNKNELNSDVLRILGETRERFGASRFKLVANLPYAVATPLIGNLLLSDWIPERMVVTVQWEIAERLTANPGTKEYSALSVFVQSVADVEIIRRLAPSVFWPKPQVASAIVMIRPNAAKRQHVGDATRFRHFLRDLYTHRRKNLRSALAALPQSFRDKPKVDQRLAELGLEGTVRAEALDVEQHLRLCAAFGSPVAPTKAASAVLE
jgi:16S rRNA (adenine1518-N6/adenine1519-N6)-dimethyltransferase